MTDRLSVSGLTLRYRRLPLSLDLALGLLSSGFGLLMLVANSSLWLLILGGLVFIAGTWLSAKSFLQLMTAVSLSDKQISRTTPFSHSAAEWTALQSYKLRFIGSRKARGSGKGSYFLTLRWADRSMHLDQRLDGFEQVIACAAATPANRDDLTQHNLTYFRAR